MALISLPAYLDWPAQFCLFCTVTTWVLSIITSNVSQVDRLWTFLPTIYTAYYALLPALPNAQPFVLAPYAPKALGWATLKDFSPRALLMFSLIFTWMCRLSYNTYRRGLFKLHDEDYRWIVLRRQLPPWLFQVFNLTFVACIQNMLLLLLALPTYTAAILQPHTSLATSDYILAAIALSLLAIEFTADNQQYAFHGYKHAYLAQQNLAEGSAKPKAYDPAEHWPFARLAWTPYDAKRGFITRGLWRYSRHPNFACEQSFWWVITLFPLLSPSAPSLPSLSEIPPLLTIFKSLLNPSLYPTLLESLWTTFSPSLYYLSPALALSALFFSSTAFTEDISSSKYPEAYAAYQKRVGMFLPVDTILKALKLKLFGGEKEEEKVNRLVWGASHVKNE